MLRTIVFVLFSAALVAGQADDTSDVVPESEITADDIQIYALDRSSPCSISGTTGSCCVKIVIKKLKINATTCLKIEVDVATLTVAGSITVNGKEWFKHDLLSATKWCVSLPPPAVILKACFKIRYVDVKPKEKLVDICTGISVSSLIGYDFPCIRYKDGKLSTHNEH